MRYVVFTMDCISSKKVQDVTKLLEEKTKKLNNDEMRNSSFLTDFSVRIGDEIQGVLRYDGDFVKNVRYIREAFFPVKIRVGIGIGNIDGGITDGVKDSWKLNGSAFHNARESLEYLSHHNLYGKKPLSHLISGDSEFDLLINNQLLLYDTILSRWREKTYEAVYLKEKYGSLRKLDNLNDISASAYTKRANAGNWSILEEFEKNINHIISVHGRLDQKK